MIDAYHRIDSFDTTYIGKEWGSWTQISSSFIAQFTPKGRRLRYCICRCKCGKINLVRMCHLVSGNSQQCIKCRPTKHKACGTSEYNCWQNIIQRCTNPLREGYDDYGARGISICERWLDFNNFLVDMGRKPTPEHQIDRIDNDGDYEPSNCQWVTPKENANNRVRR